MQRIHLAITCGLAVTVVVLSVLLWQAGSAGYAPPPEAVDDPAAAPESLDGLWSGAWGGGERDGVVFQPVIAEAFIRGDHVELAGFPDIGRLEGTVRFDVAARRMHVTPRAETGGEPAPGSIGFAYEINKDDLTLTRGETAILLKKVLVATRPLVNAEVELVAATGITDAGELLVTQFAELRAGRTGDIYFRPVDRSLQTGQATIFQAQRAGLKKLSVDQARRLIQKPTPVVIAYRQIHVSAYQSHELWTELGQPTPDSEAARQTFARIVRPGTLVFILPGRENIPVP
jgi:hypothetical protein